MKTVAITCVRNEADIIEPFVRHALAYCGDLLIIDHGSTDATPEILQRLQVEGLRLHVTQDPTLGSIHVDLMNRLLLTAAHDFSADWIFCIDADEFISGPADASFLPPAAAPGPDCFKIGWRSYYATQTDPAGVLNPAERITHRLAREWWETQPGSAIVSPKLIVRGDAVRRKDARLTNLHNLVIGGQQASHEELLDVRLAHFSLRSPAQFATKLVAFHLQKLRYLSPRRGENSQYDEPYARLRAGYPAFAENFYSESNPGQPPHNGSDLVREPLRYLGGPLRHTPPPAEVGQFIRDLLDLSARLARTNTAPDAAQPGATMAIEARPHPSAAAGESTPARVPADPAITHTLTFPLDCPPETVALHLHFHCEKGMLEISSLTLLYADTAERTWHARELAAMLAVLENAAPLIYPGACRFLVSQLPAALAFRGWRDEPQSPLPIALLLKVRHEGNLMQSGLFTSENLALFNSASVSRKTPGEHAGPTAKVFVERMILPVGGAIDFSEKGNAAFFETHGWSHPEPWGTWSDGEKAAVKIRIENIHPSQPLRLIANAQAFVAPGQKEQRVEVLLDGAQIATWNLLPGDIRQYTAAIPPGKITRRECEIAFLIPGALSPQSLGLSIDARRLGIGLARLRIDRP